MKIAIGLFFLATWHIALAQTELRFQDVSSLRIAAESFLTTHTNGLPGEKNITIGKIDSRLKLPLCENISPFLPPGSKPWGKINLGIRCAAPKPWTIYVSAHVQMNTDYYVTTSPLSQGQLIGISDIRKVNGDVANLPIGVITNPNQAIGRTLITSLTSGSVLRMDALKSFPAIQQGQTIKVLSSGPGFQISTEALALNNANEGQIAKAKTLSGQYVSGIARMGGILEISF
jgi:flagella basal body P-ring formation protein FlgA